MPALRLFGRKWLIASDDFMISAIVDLLFRFINWLIVLVLVSQIFYPATMKCPNEWDGRIYVRVFLTGTLTLQALHIILLALLAYMSSRGSIMNHQARRGVPLLIYIKLFLVLPDIVFNAMGTKWIFTEAINCSVDQTPPRILMQCIVLFYWLLIGFTFVTIIIVYDPVGRVSHGELQEIVNKARLEGKSEGLWSWRFQCAFGCVKKDDHGKEIFEKVAALFYNLIRTTDLVPSDVVAGIILLGARQKQEQAADLKRIRTPLQTFPSRWMNLENAVHYLKMCVASYGCLFAMYQNLLTGPYNLMRHLTCCGCRQNNPRVSGDNCCLCNYAGVKHLSKYPEENILYASFDNGVFEVPFYVVLDRERMEIIVAVRGTLSFKDIFTDCTAWSAKFEADDEGLPENTTAHKGFSMSTAKVLERLLPILEEAFEQFPEYNLVITGHSLGAGVAVLLGIKLRAKYRNVRVFAFSTPASLISREAAKYTESFVMTVGLGDDVVMRLGVHSIEAFNDKLIKAIHTSKLPKYRIMLRGVGYAFCGIPIQTMESAYDELDDLENHTNGLTGSVVQSTSIITITKTQCSSMPRLYPGGMILHISKQSEYKDESSPNEPEYEIRWASPEDYLEVQVSSRMLLDHMPDEVVKAIEIILKEKDIYTDDVIQSSITN